MLFNRVGLSGGNLPLRLRRAIDAPNENRGQRTQRTCAETEASLRAGTAHCVGPVDPKTFRSIFGVAAQRIVGLAVKSVGGLCKLKRNNVLGKTAGNLGRSEMASDGL
jgi:hypothetical protein